MSAASEGVTSPESGERPDLRLVPPALGAWLTALLTLGTSAGTALWVALGAALAAAALCVARPVVPWKTVTAAGLVCAAAAAASVGLRLAAVTTGPLRGLAEGGAEATLEVVIAGAGPQAQPREVHGSDTRRYVLVPSRARMVDADDGRVRINAPVLIIASGPGWEDLLPSQRVRVRGQLELPRYDPLLTAVLFVRGPPEVLSEPSPLQRAAGDIRAGLRAAVRPLPAEEAGLLPGLVVGDTSMMTPRVDADFREAGLTHLTAVSGANVAIVLAAVLGIARLLGCGIRTAPLLAGLGVLGFAVLARPSPSVLRATVMGLITVIGLATGRPRRALPALCAATCGLVLFDPGLARSYGFALSVIATGGLVLLTPVWRDRMEARVPRGLAEALAVPAAAQVVCLPIIVMLSGQVSLVAIPANLLVAPAVAPATILGVLAAVTAPVWLPLARLFAHVGGLAAHWIIEVAHAGAAVPHATVPWPSGLVGAGLALAVLLAIAVARAPLRRLVAICLVGVLLATSSLRVVVPAWPPQGWLLVMCDVGQGDALVLAAGEGTAVVVDAGPDPRIVHRCLRRLDVRRVPLLVLTHPHADHVVGVPGVLRGRKVGAALTAPLQGRQREGAPVDAWLRSAQVPSRHAVTGQRLRIGRLRLRVLGPPGRMRLPDAGSSEEASVNNAGIVLRASWPGSPTVTALLAGDIEPEAQRRLLSSAHLEADILKVPHHGSAAQDPAFLAAVDPRVAITSVGRENDYGHPSPTTLRLLRWLGARTYRTDRDGSIAIVRREGGRLAVVVRGPRRE